MRAPFWLVVAFAVVAAGCGPTVDLTQGLEVIDVATGWKDAGIVDGKNKLVPTASFRLRNRSEESLVVLEINALFKRAGETDEWGSAFLTAAGSDGLAPGATTDLITMSSNLGYTGTEPRAQMLQNQQFVDTRVELFAKYSSAQWQLVAEHPIARVVLP